MRAIIFCILFVMSVSVSADSVDKDKVARRDPKTGLWGYVNGNDSSRSAWYKRANRVSFGTLGIDGGTKNEMLNHGYEEEWIISPQYDAAAKYFSEGLAAVELHGKVGFIDSLNRFAIEPKFESASNLKGFNLGLSAVKVNGKYGFIDKKGEFVIKPEYDYADNFRDNKLATIKQDGKFGAVNLNGEIVVPCKYLLEEAMINVPVSNKAYKQAVEQVAADYAGGEGKFSDNMAKVAETAEEVDAAIRAVDEDMFQPFREITVRGAEGAMGVYLSDGSCVVSPVYDDIVAQPDNMLLVSKGGKWGVSDFYGRCIVPVDYDIVTYDENSHMIVADKGGKIGLFRTTGRMILPPCLDGIDDFVDGKAFAYINYESGLVDTDGEISGDLLENVFLQAATLDETGTDKMGALRLYRQVIMARPDFAMAHNNIGIMQIEDGEYRDGMNRLKVANKLDPGNAEIASNLKQAKKDRNQRRWNRIGRALEMATAVLTVAAETYTAVETARNGGSDISGASSSSGGSSCAQILSELKRYEKKLGKESVTNSGREGYAAGKNAVNRIVPENEKGATYSDYSVINSSKSLIRTYQKRVDELKRQAGKKGCL